MNQRINNGDHWLLPVGVEETLPAEAAHIESLRRKVLDLLDSWGYELVMPPLMEFLDSLLTGTGHALEIETFKLTDQISGRMMGVRADMTPQVARIDAHYLRSEEPRRLCYFGPVLRTRPDCLGCSRVPLQLGAELFGVKSSQADVEIVELLVETLHCIGLTDLHIDLGHMGVFQGLCRSENLDATVQEKLSSAIASRSRDDVAELCRSLSISVQSTKLFVLLSSCSGDVGMLNEHAETFSSVSEDVRLAFENLSQISSSLRQRLPDLRIYFDLSALKGKSYHNGLVFSVYVPGTGRAIASGGRYDDIGLAFGRARPATGFSLDLRAISTCVSAPEQASQTIRATYQDDPALLEAVRQLRQSGKRVIFSYEDSSQDDTAQEHEPGSQLVKQNGEWLVV